MPDVHSGKGCVIGFTADLGKKVVPNLVGVDIGCGMLTTALGNMDIDFKKLDSVINDSVPAGFEIHEKPSVSFEGLNSLNCRDSLQNIDRIRLSVWNPPLIMQKT